MPLLGALCAAAAAARAAGGCAPSVRAPRAAAAAGAPVALAFEGRPDAGAGAYAALLDGLQAAAAPANVSMWVVSGCAFADMQAAVDQLVAAHGAAVLYAGHGMATGGGAVAAQDYVKTHAAGAAGVVLLAGFLQRRHRPDIAACIPKWRLQPNVTDDHPLGYLADGSHDCHGPNTVDYPVPTLTVGGELDGVVRIARVAEAHYTQAVLAGQAQHPVVVIEGMSHSSLLSAAPAAVAPADLPATIPAADAVRRVAAVVAGFAARVAAARPPAESATGVLPAHVAAAARFFAPFHTAFAELEGNWFFTGGDEEHGSSPWAAAAQVDMIEPLPQGWAAGNMTNEFHLLSDEGRIPPYYRPMHRPNITVGAGRTLGGPTVTQLRYMTESVADTHFGTNGSAIILEEKCGLLNSLRDDGAGYVSAIEMATKLVSRQLAFNLSATQPQPESLDLATSRCGPYNQKAIDWALSHASPAARQRYADSGVPLVIAPDRAPSPSSGPFWIWTYLQYDPTPSSVNVTAWYGFYPMSGPAYGAGNHYCKLLSPARALEWIYTDSLRKAAH